MIPRWLCSTHQRDQEYDDRAGDRQAVPQAGGAGRHEHDEDRLGAVGHA
jgi:hypothetical protein